MSKIYAPFQRPETVPDTITGSPFQRELTVAIQSITLIEGTIWKYHFATGADLSVWEHLRTATFSGCLNPDDDGEFDIVAIDLVNSTISVDNINGVAQAIPSGNLTRTILGHALHTDAIITAGKITVDALQGFKTAAYTVTTTPTVFPTAPINARKVMTVYNLSLTDKVYLGSSAIHTIADSIPIYPSDAWTFNLSDNAINTYFFTASGMVQILVVEGS